MEKFMLKAHELQAQGFTQKQIAEQLGRSERTIRTWLKQTPRKRKLPVRKSILDEYKPFIEILVRENPEVNGAKIYEKLLKMGFTGKSSIVREFITKIRKEETQKATIRFETEPAHQAQVDWIEFGKQYVNGTVQKLYAFVIVMGFSRMPFVHFTTRMDSATLLHCHIKAFEFFGGVPEEILYDNMKTAWYYDGEHWQTNRQLARFAYHYGFVPKRCKIHRPETKGKVERFNKYFENNFFVDYDNKTLYISQLNEDAVSWIKKISNNKLVQFNQTRNERFAIEKVHLRKLPALGFDVRDSIPLVVSRESCITFRTNKYSVPPAFIGKTITAKPFVEAEKLELFDSNGVSIRVIDCAPAGSRQSFISVEDQEAIMQAWEKGLKKDAIKRQAKKTLKFNNPEYVAIRNPVFYEQFLAGGL
ncbi:MAG: IS21 family transposase [Spirochaetales bacterium]|nr:IS21 family transposase [Spirochaetales bacterium]